VARYTESFIAELQAFVQCILADAPAPVTGFDGRVPVVMAMAAKLSLLESRWVSMSEIA